MGPPADPPAGFVGVKGTAVPGLLTDLFVPIGQDFRESIPHRQQATGTEDRMQVTAENCFDMGQGHPQAVMEPCGKTDKAVPQAGLGQGVWDYGLDVFPAMGTVISMNSVFGDFGLGILGDVLDDSLPQPVAALQRTAAVRTDVTAMLFFTIDTLRRLSPSRWMSGLGPSLGLASVLVGLGIDRPLSRGRGRMGCLTFELGNGIGSRQDRQLNGLGAESGQLQGLLFRARPVQDGLDNRIEAGR